MNDTNDEHTLNDLQQRIKDLKAEALPAPPAPPSSSDDDKKGLGAAYELIMTPIVCGGIGAGIDHVANTRPVFFISLAFLGVCAGFWRIYKASNYIQTPLEKNRAQKRLQETEKKDKKTQLSESDK